MRRYWSPNWSTSDVSQHTVAVGEGRFVGIVRKSVDCYASHLMRVPPMVAKYHHECISSSIGVLRRYRMPSWLYVFMREIMIVRSLNSLLVNSDVTAT